MARLWSLLVLSCFVVSSGVLSPGVPAETSFDAQEDSEELQEFVSTHALDELVEEEEEKMSGEEEEELVDEEEEESDKPHKAHKARKKPAKKHRMEFNKSQRAKTNDADDGDDDMPLKNRTKMNDADDADDDMPLKNRTKMNDEDDGDDDMPQNKSNSSRARMAPRKTRLHFNGKCTKQDHTAMFKLGSGSAKGSFPQLAQKCTNSAFEMFTGLNVLRFSQCMMKDSGISQPCAACFADASSATAFWCGGACMFSWCGQPCLACTQTYRNSNLKSCVGFASPAPKEC